MAARIIAILVKNRNDMLAERNSVRKHRGLVNTFFAGRCI
jgi:hypothetical protein